MTISDKDRLAAEQRMRDELKGQPKAVRASYDRRRARVVIGLDNGLELAFPPNLAQGLENATPAALSKIEISPLGTGLHWPELDADLYVPGLLAGMFGSKSWMAARLGAAGGQARSAAKTAAVRENGRKGGRPRKVAAG
jgi:hypothetical protein